jgi:hypothetical protein
MDFKTALEELIDGLKAAEIWRKKNAHNPFFQNILKSVTSLWKVQLVSNAALEDQLAQAMPKITGHVR